MPVRTYPSLTDLERLQLRAFHRQFDRIRQSRIGQQKTVTISKTFKFDFKTGEATFTTTGFEAEAFQSQLPILRQFMLEQEPVNFFKVCKLIRWKCPRPELAAWIDEAKKRWQEILKNVPDSLPQHLCQNSMTLEQAIDKLFYGFGGLFHLSLDAQEEEEAAVEAQRSHLQASFPKLGWCLNVVDSVIYWWLDAPDATVPAIPGSQAAIVPPSPPCP